MHQGFNVFFLLFVLGFGSCYLLPVLLDHLPLRLFFAFFLLAGVLWWQHSKVVCTYNVVAGFCTWQVRGVGKRGGEAYLFRLGDELISFTALHQLLAVSIPEMMPVVVSDLILSGKQGTLPWPLTFLVSAIQGILPCRPSYLTLSPFVSDFRRRKYTALASFVFWSR